MIPTRSAKPRANTRQPVQVRVSRAARMEHARQPTAKVSLPMSSPASRVALWLCGEGGEHGHDVGSAPRSALLLDALIPFSPSFVYPPRGGRAGLASIAPHQPTRPPRRPPTTNNYQMGQSETNARLGGPPELRTKLYAQCERAAGPRWAGGALTGRKRDRERKRPTGPSSAGPGPQTQRPDGLPPCDGFYSRNCCRYIGK